jgi:hypothetical protein
MNKAKKRALDYMEVQRTKKSHTRQESCIRAEISKGQFPHTVKKLPPNATRWVTAIQLNSLFNSVVA